MLYTKIQLQSFLSSGEEVFYHIWAWQPSCSKEPNNWGGGGGGLKFDLVIKRSKGNLVPLFEQTW